MLISCTSSSGNTSAPIIAAVPKVYRDGCPKPLLIPGNPKINEGRLAVALGSCARLQLDGTRWAVHYLAGLGATKP